jgi:hypothetical protein
LLSAYGERTGNAELLELRGHRRIDVLVGAGDLVAAVAEQAANEAMAVPAIAERWIFIETEASSTSKRASSPWQVRRARAPSGSVMLGAVAWPLERPSAIGMSSPTTNSRMTPSSV